MYDIALDSQGDIAIVNGDLVLTNSISQAVLIAMRWAKGEWKYNTELGVDYFGSILAKSPDLNTITRIILSPALISPETIRKIRGRFVSPTALKTAAP